MKNKLKPEEALRLILEISSQNSYHDYQHAVREIAQSWNTKYPPSITNAEIDSVLRFRQKEKNVIEFKDPDGHPSKAFYENPGTSALMTIRTDLTRPQIRLLKMHMRALLPAMFD